MPRVVLWHPKKEVRGVGKRDGLLPKALTAPYRLGSALGCRYHGRGVPNAEADCVRDSTAEAVEGELTRDPNVRRLLSSAHAPAVSRAPKLEEDCRVDEDMEVERVSVERDRSRAGLVPARRPPPRRASRRALKRLRGEKGDGGSPSPR